MRLSVLTFIACLIVTPAQAKYSGGTGEPNDPYQIATAADLVLLGETPGDYTKHFILTADIDLDPNLPGRKVFGKAVIAPDVNDVNMWFDGTAFTGIFDGNGHTISHLTITGVGYLGLFGAAVGEVKNLGVVDVKVVGSGSYVGGLAGYNWGTVTGCYSSGSVSGTSHVGGLVGYNYSSIITSYSIGSVSGGSDVGGLVGSNAYGPVTDCYSTGAVSGTSSVGGLVGSNSNQVSACFWDAQTSGQAKSAGGTGRTTGEMQTAATFRAWGTCGKEGIWTIDEGRDYPRLWWQNRSGEPIVFERSLRDVLAGEGTEQSPFMIQTAEELNSLGLFPCDWDKHFKLVADTDLSAFDGKDGRPAFNIIGDCYPRYCNPELYCPNPVLAGNPFTGVFDGNGHTISHLRVNVRSRFGGLFDGLGSGGQVRNLGVVDVNVISSFCLPPDSPEDDTYWGWYSCPAGGLVGYNDRGTLTNCYSTGVVHGIGSAAGGLVGVNVGTVTACYSTAAVSGASSVGGLVGYTWWGPVTVTRCYSTGAVSGDWAVGGLVGSSSGQVTQCYSTGAVDGNGNVGGLVGYNYQGAVTRCYSTGAVSGDWAVGGLVGSSSGQVTQCYSTGAVSGNEYVGGLAGWNDSTVTHCYSAGAVSGQLHVGGFIGRRSVGGTIDSRSGMVLHNVWDMETSGQPGSDGGVGLTRSQMMDPYKLGLNGFANDPDWILDAGRDYPRLAWQGTPGQMISEPDIDWLEGQGTADAPYRIDTAEQLMLLACASALWAQHFVLGADIDLDPALPGRQVFDQAPIQVFTGTFDGNGHVISHVTITGAGDLGLFGRLGFGTKVRNVGVVDVNITGSGSCVGGLAGRGDGEVTNCHSTGAVTGNDYVGGLLGCDAQYSVAGIVGSISGDLIQCYSTGRVSGNDHVGGLVGSKCGTLRYCYSTCTVSGTTYVGGLAGYTGYDGEVTRCYSTGTVSGTSYVGGLAGRAGEVTNCYSIGAVTGTDYVGGLLGSGNVDRVTASFWNIETSRQSTSPGGTGKTTAEMRGMQTYLDTGWDFAGEIQNGTHETWQMPQGGGYPLLAVFNGYTPPKLQGEGTPESPYLIANPMELGAVIYYSADAHYRLAAAVDLSNIRWGTAVIPSFSGTFDGNNLTISHLTVRGENRLGLIGQLEAEGKVKNLGVVDVNIVGSNSHYYVGALVGLNGGTVIGCSSTSAVSGQSYVGGLMGYNYGHVAHCSSTGTVGAIEGVAGGLVGSNDGSIASSSSAGAVSGYDSLGGLAGCNSGELTNCYSTGPVTGTGQYSSGFGGLVGCNSEGTVTHCYSTGTVSGSSRIGGLVGDNTGRGGTANVTQCYSIGAVSGDWAVGGLVGYNDYGGLVTQCYSIGAVSGKSGVGGLVGYCNWSAMESFWDTQTSGQSASAGGTGKTTAEMQTASTFLTAGWDFVGETANGTEDIWWILEGKDYPRLWWEAALGNWSLRVAPVSCVSHETPCKNLDIAERRNAAAGRAEMPLRRS